MSAFSRSSQEVKCSCRKLKCQVHRNCTITFSLSVVDFPHCLVTFPRCLFFCPNDSYRCIFSSLKCLVTSDIAMYKVVKLCIAVEVKASQIYPTCLQCSLMMMLLISKQVCQCLLVPIFYSGCFVRAF